LHFLAVWNCSQILKCPCDKTMGWWD
jgi:hypothetical protein